MKIETIPAEFAIKEAYFHKEYQHLAYHLYFIARDDDGNKYTLQSDGVVKKSAECEITPPSITIPFRCDVDFFGMFQCLFDSMYEAGLRPTTGDDKMVKELMSEISSLRR